MERYKESFKMNENNNITYEQGVEAIQSYIDDNYDDETYTLIEKFCISNNFKSDKNLTLYRGLFFDEKFKMLDKISTQGYFLDKEGISFTKDKMEAEAFAYGSNIFSYKGKHKNQKLENDEGVILKTVILSKDILIDIQYCLQKNLLPEVSWIEENEVLVTKQNRKLKPIDAIDKWGWWSLSERKF